ncbi:MAG: hypothetical protein ACPG4U_07035 [Pseudomonadales bacterium]
MTTSPLITAQLSGEHALTLRPVAQVMDLERLGAAHQSRLSFMRTLVRRIMRERWKINAERMELDDQGYGTVVYSIVTAQKHYSFVLFSNYLSPEERNDRVIASKWDLTMALVDGPVSDAYVEQLRDNVPKQEAGRVDARVFVLSRANRSARNFDYVIDCLSRGEQPSTAKISQVGYLYRTTAVYGSGKLGMADWERVKTHCPDFASPFCAEMFVCLMLRNFSLFQVEHIARERSPDHYQPLELTIKRFFGIGNSTGLGMAPYLINHPQLVSRWVEIRELALARVRSLGAVNSDKIAQLKALLVRCAGHTEQTVTEDDWQSANNHRVLSELEALQQRADQALTSWDQLIEFSEQQCSLQGQEMLVSVLLELYPEYVDELENHLVVEESLDLDPLMSLAQLQQLIEQRYDWALSYNFDAPEASETFWYRSEEKMEPRLGNAQCEPGLDKQMPLGVARDARTCYDALKAYCAEYPAHNVANFMLRHPEHRSIVRRMQSMARCHYGDIQANLLDKNVLPMHLLRCKLAFFGVGKFDPRSKLWVRNTMFQGAPLLEEINQSFSDDWFMPLAPNSDEAGE